jgi:thioredoxin 1
MSAISQVTAQTFESEVLQSPIPVLVDLYAPWCGPCQMLSVVLDKLAPQFAGRVKFVKINTDEQPDLARAFQVSSIPTVVLVQEGKVVESFVGLAPAKTIQQLLEKVAAPVGAAQ